MTGISGKTHTSFADKVGTGATKIEKKVVDQTVEKVKEAVHKVKDSINRPQGKPM